MGIINVIDRRERRYRFLKVNAVVEAAWHDNGCADADQIEAAEGPDYAQVEHIDVESAIKWANGYASPVTLFLYDEDSGIYPIGRLSNAPAEGV